MNNFVIFGIGSNLGDRFSNINLAHNLLKSYLGLGSFKVSSSIYETLPLVEDSAKDDYKGLNFYNLCSVFTTTFSALDIFKNVKIIEKQVGRKLAKKWGAREIDIDILLYRQMLVNLPNLKIPHPEIEKRDFVLTPLIEVLKLINELEYLNIFEQKLQNLETRYILKKLDLNLM